MEIEAASERGPIFDTPERKRETHSGVESFSPAPRMRERPGTVRDTRPSASAPPVIERIARPAVSARKNAMASPPTSRSPNDWTIGIGERMRTRNPAAVASAAVATTGPPAAAASAAARAGDEPDRRASTKRAWSWIA